MMGADNEKRYAHGEIECIDAIRAALTVEEFKGFCKGNIMKYIWRERYKGGEADLAKAADYLAWAIGGGRMTSATDELRRLLDEHGVEWDYGITGATTTRFNANGVDLTFTPMRDGLVCSTILTPAQAIAATLGATDARPTQAESSGTCRMVLREDIRGHAYQDTYECSECGEYVVRETYMGESEPPNFCPNCGAKVIEPTTNDVDAEVDE